MATDAMQKAINFFTLWELLGRKEASVKAAWQRVKAAIDVSRPINLRVGEFLGRFDLDPESIRQKYYQVAQSFSALREDDLVMELGDPDYPAILAQTDDAPVFLFLRGRIELLDRPGLAVVGTRNPTDEGRARSRKLGYLLAKRGVVVVSGLARGIDTEAHRGALDAGGDTVAVIGTPLNKVYPKENAELQELIGEIGVVVSQFYPGAGVSRFNFPMWNAVMSGLTLGTAVIEASETSGALIQARKCLQQDRKLFIPNSAVENPKLTWPRTYLSRGAVRFSNIEEVLEQLPHNDLHQEEPPEGRETGHKGSCLLKLTT